ncbi:MAG: RluA family pseudouridine synthase [bacterium]
MDIPILFEDSEMVVIDKPSGIICNRAETVKAETLQDWMEERYQITNHKFSNSQIEGEKYFLDRSGLVHRLDKETSGVMVLAKTVEAFVELLRQFKAREVQKEYLALTHGIWQARKGDITLPIGRRRDDRKKFGVREDGRESSTNYEVEAEYKNWEFPKELKVDDRGYTGFSLVRFRPKTGRTHQIRVHARQVGHPIVGDLDYAGRKRSREDRKWASSAGGFGRPKAGRVMLQAQKIEFNHPRNGKRISFESKNEELKEVLKYFSPKI